MFNVFPDKTTLLESPVLISKPLRKNLNIFRLKRFSTRLSGKALFLLLPLHQHYKRPLSLVLSSETQSSKNPAHKCFRRLASSCEFQRNLHLVPGFQRRGQSAYLYIYTRARESVWDDGGGVCRLAVKRKGAKAPPDARLRAALTKAGRRLDGRFTYTRRDDGGGFFFRFFVSRALTYACVYIMRARLCIMCLCIHGMHS